MAINFAVFLSGMAVPLRPNGVFGDHIDHHISRRRLSKRHQQHHGELKWSIWGKSANRPGVGSPLKWSDSITLMIIDIKTTFVRF